MQDDIYSDDSCATAMYAHRKAEDSQDPTRAKLHEGPNARELYMLGAHDLIVMLDAYREHGVNAEALSSMLRGVHDETCPQAGKTCH